MEKNIPLLFSLLFHSLVWYNAADFMNDTFAILSFLRSSTCSLRRLIFISKKEYISYQL